MQSQNDAAKLAEAKNMVYLKGFTDGVMEVGPYAGRKVSEVKPIIRDELIAEGLAMPYSEPEKQARCADDAHSHECNNLLVSVYIVSSSSMHVFVHPCTLHHRHPSYTL